jgi:hypothetical protein
MEDQFSVLIGKLNKPVIFAGAGLSIDAPSNLLSGYAIIKGIIEHSILDAYKDSLLNHMSPPPFSSNNPGGFLRFESLIHRLRSYDRNLEVLKYLKDCVSPNLNHYILASLIHKGHTVITTNFDNLIEMAYENLKGTASKELVSIIYDEEFRKTPQENKNYLWKIHGSFKRNGIDTTDSIQAEYTKVMINNHRLGKKKFLESIVANHDMIVIGYSGSDDLDIIPVLAETPSQKQMVWVRHATDFKDITQTVYEESGRVKSKYHALGIHKVMYEKQPHHLNVIEAKTTDVIAKLLDTQEVAHLIDLTAKEHPYSLSDDYFQQWIERVNFGHGAKRDFTKSMLEDHFFDFDPAEFNTISDGQDNDYAFQVKLIVERFNERGTNNYQDLKTWLNELQMIKKSIKPMEIPLLCNILACIQFELGMEEESRAAFYELLLHYEATNDISGQFMMFDALEQRFSLTQQEHEKKEAALHNIGYYPVIWRRKFNEYAGILWPIHSYISYVNESGEHLLNYRQAIDDLIGMKIYSIVMGDPKGERRIDKLLWKLDYFEEGIASDFKD